MSKLMHQVICLPCRCMRGVEDDCSNISLLKSHSRPTAFIANCQLVHGSIRETKLIEIENNDFQVLGITPRVEPSDGADS